MNPEITRIEINEYFGKLDGKTRSVFEAFLKTADGKITKGGYIVSAMIGDPADNWRMFNEKITSAGLLTAAAENQWIEWQRVCAKYHEPARLKELRRQHELRHGLALPAMTKPDNQDEAQGKIVFTLNGKPTTQ